MAQKIVERFKFSLEDQKAIVRLVSRHMILLSDLDAWGKKGFKRFLADEQCEDLLTFTKSDILSSSGNMGPLEKLEEARAAFAFADEPVKPDPLIGGHDLIMMGCKPGPLFSTILDRLGDEQLEGTISTADEAIAFVRQHFL
jgi:poly(A) polymerase